MLKKWLASVGIGSAKVDTQLEKDNVTVGEQLTGKVVVEGGKTEQQVDQINLFLMTEAAREVDDSTVYEKVKLDSFTVGDSFTIGEGETKELDFSFALPVNTPPTLGRTKVWVQTGMDVPDAIDPKDRDFIEVEPHRNMSTILEALTNVMGFQLRKVEMEYSRRYSYVQEYELLPSGDFRGDLDELEAMFFMKEDQVEMVLQIDRRAKGLGGLFAEALETDESFVKIDFTNAEIDKGSNAIADKLKRAIKQFI